MSIIVRRPRLEEFLRRSSRRLLYGRRKTGKTFYVRYVLSGYQYFIVRKGGIIHDPVEDQEIDTRTFIRLLGNRTTLYWMNFVELSPDCLMLFRLVFVVKT